MSETEHWKGTLKPTGRTWKEVLDNHYKEKGYPEHLKEADREILVDWFYHTFYQEKIIINELVYDIHKEDITYNNDQNAYVDEHGEVVFNIKYYNGSRGFDEAIQLAFEKAGLHDEKVTFN